MAITMLKIRRPLGRLIFNMGIAIPGKTIFLIETAPRILALWESISHQGFTSQGGSNTENVSSWWRHHGKRPFTANRSSRSCSETNITIGHRNHSSCIDHYIHYWHDLYIQPVVFCGKFKFHDNSFQLISNAAVITWHKSNIHNSHIDSGCI